MMCYVHVVGLCWRDPLHFFIWLAAVLLVWGLIGGFLYEINRK